MHVTEHALYTMHVSIPLTLVYIAVDLLPPPFNDHHNHQHHKENEEQKPYQS